MLLLLPPSETKRAGGAGRSLSLDALAFPQLAAQRESLVTSVVALADDADATIAALKLGPKQHGEVEVNRALAESPTMPAIDRYTGVLYDALDAASLTTEQRRFAAEHVVVHSALFGLVGALDPIPAYRLSHSSRVPGLQLKRHWRSTVEELLAARTGLILDLRSEGYADLGPAPKHGNARYVRVLSEGPNGVRRALNHFNKKAKGEFARAVITARLEADSVDELSAWAESAGIRLEEHGAELALIV